MTTSHLPPERAARGTGGDRGRGESPEHGVLAQLVERSRRIGADYRLVVHGGGNTSAKGVLHDRLDRAREVLWVKGSGADLETAAAPDFPALWLDELLALRDLEELSDEAMTELLRGALVDPSSRRPSIETLLHAFVPFRHVDHVHADSVVALTKAPDAAAVVRRALGERVGFLPWVRPGFALAKLVAGMAGLDGVVLAHHGLVTWADDGDECLERTMALVGRAGAYLAKSSGSPGPSLAAPPAPPARPIDSGCAASCAGVTGDEPCGPSPGPRELEDLLLTLRGALSRRSRKVLHVDERLRAVASRPELPEIVAAGVATADHMLRMRPWAVVVRGPGDAARAIDGYEQAYRAYFDRHAAALTSGYRMHDPAPAAVLVPGLGAVTAATDARGARVVADILLHTTEVAAAALDAFGSVVSLPEEAVFDVDYWPLELYKLTLAPPAPELAGHVVCVTGAASGIGRAVAAHLGRLGAHLVLGDLDADGLGHLAQELTESGASPPACTVGDVTDEAVVDALVMSGVRAFGGLDGFVVNAGVASVGELAEMDTAEWRRVLDVNLTAAMLVTRQAIRVLRRQGLGGSIVYVASKNAFAPGTDFAAYSVSKAGMVQLMRVAAIEGGRDGIRANAVNPDAVFEGSRLWSEEIRRARAAAHGIGEEGLEDFYARRNLLGARVGADDVARAVAFLLSARSGRTTGAVIPVDGRVVGAFPR